MATDIKHIMDELKGIRSDLDYIKRNMPDKDMFLTKEEQNLLDQSFKNQKEKKLVPLDEFEKEL